MILSTLKKMFKKEVIEQNGMEIKIKDVGEDNALDTFLNTLSETDKNKKVFDLTQAQICDYVKALAIFQTEAIEDLLDCSSKAMTMLCHRLYETNNSEVNFKINFIGTKDEVKEENFTFKLKEIKENMAQSKSDVTSETSEYAEDNSKEPHEKVNTFLNQPEKVWELFQQVKQALPDKKEGLETAFTTAGLLIVFEYMSARNIADKQAKLEGLVKGDVQLGKSFEAHITREEIEYKLSNRPVDNYDMNSAVKNKMKLN